MSRTIKHRMEYDWRLHGSHCHFVHTEIWRLEKIELAKATPPKKSKPNCKAPGPTSRISVHRPGSLKVEGGKSIKIRATPVDKNGCRTKARISWKANRGKIDRNGVLSTQGVQSKRIKVSARVKDIKRTLHVRVIAEAVSSRLAPRGPRYDPTLTIQEEDRLPFYGLQFQAKSSPYVETRSWWRRGAIPTLLILSGILSIILGVRLRRRHNGSG